MKAFVQDWHVHNFVSHDGTGHVEDFVLQALKRGVSLICFCNHPERMGMHHGDIVFEIEEVIDKLKREKEEISECREKYGDQITLFQGIEIENRASLQKKNEELLSRYRFDRVMGSCHLIGGENISSKRNQDFLRDKDPDEMYGRFLDETCSLIESYSFHILGHFDIVKRFGVIYHGKFRPEKYEDRIRAVFDLLKKKGRGLEVNTSGFFQDPGEPYPSEDLALAALEQGVPFVVTGSDAHRPEDLARGFEKLKRIDRYNRG